MDAKLSQQLKLIRHLCHCDPGVPEFLAGGVPISHKERVAGQMHGRDVAELHKARVLRILSGGILGPLQISDKKRWASTMMDPTNLLDFLRATKDPVGDHMWITGDRFVISGGPRHGALTQWDN